MVSYKERRLRNLKIFKACKGEISLREIGKLFNLSKSAVANARDVGCKCMLHPSRRNKTVDEVITELEGIVNG